MAHPAPAPHRSTGRPEVRRRGPARAGALAAAAGGALRRQPAGAWLIAGAVTALYCAYSTAQWHRLESPSWDLGIFTQLAKAYAGFDAPVVPIKGESFNLLGDHFHPLLVLLGPVYALFPSAFALLVVQNLLFGLSVFVVARTGLRELGRAGGTAVGLAYGLSWGLQAAAAAQFHEIAFAVPLLALSCEALIRRRLAAAVAWGALLVFVKEDLGLTVIALGLVIALRFRHAAGLWLAAWGALWLLLSVRVILPALNSGGSYDYAGRVDAAAMLADPLQAAADFFSGAPKYETALLLLVAGGVVFLRSPLALVLVPTLLWRFASTEVGYWGPGWHYSAVLMPVLFLALTDAAARLRRSGRTLPRVLAGAGCACAAAAALALLPGQSLAELADPDTYRQSPRWDAAHRLIEAVPRGASVETGVGLMAYLVPRSEVYWIGNTNPAPDFLLVDAEDWSWGTTPPADAEAHAEETYPGTAYTLVFAEDGYQLVERTR
ncbi:DUF2079 domain-containing protein [Arthrobacter frigidicola]|nr:DUF2079 domain-containing protein [Arthrobacter frigidicola]